MADVQHLPETQREHKHCWHAKRGGVWMVIKDGHTVQECCKCSAIRQVHRDHAFTRGHANG